MGHVCGHGLGSDAKVRHHDVVADLPLVVEVEVNGHVQVNEHFPLQQHTVVEA